MVGSMQEARLQAREPKAAGWNVKNGTFKHLEHKLHQLHLFPSMLHKSDQHIGLLPLSIVFNDATLHFALILSCMYIGILVVP